MTRDAGARDGEGHVDLRGAIRPVHEKHERNSLIQRVSGPFKLHAVSDRSHRGRVEQAEDADLSSPGDERIELGVTIEMPKRDRLRTRADRKGVYSFEIDLDQRATDVNQRDDAQHFHFAARGHGDDVLVAVAVHISHGDRARGHGDAVHEVESEARVQLEGLVVVIVDQIDVDQRLVVHRIDHRTRGDDVENVVAGYVAHCQARRGVSPQIHVLFIDQDVG